MKQFYKKNWKYTGIEKKQTKKIEKKPPKCKNSSLYVVAL